MSAFYVKYMCFMLIMCVFCETVTDKNNNMGETVTKSPELVLPFLQFFFLQKVRSCSCRGRRGLIFLKKSGFATDMPAGA